MELLTVSRQRHAQGRFSVHDAGPSPQAGSGRCRAGVAGDDTPRAVSSSGHVDISARHECVGACDGAREHVLGPCGSFHTPTKMCRYFMVNRCWRAKVCTFAHSSLELDDSARYEEIMADFRFDGRLWCRIFWS